ncbi:hypothetical protein [Halomicrobium salinisoli]|uniref:hypothetical protein n=1 Tax=Halomicrobium salinisoli TaxID=2878391 RepID=UPI001CEFC2CE|nr:hypothetical protein [Halomicrobium salinisoli]
MDSGTVPRSGELFRGILRRLRSETSWDVDPEFARTERQVAAVVDGETRRGELLYSHPETGARLTVRFPAPRTGHAAELLLDHALDDQLQHSEDGFAGELGEAHRSIAGRRATPYVEPVADPSLLARVRVPVEYDDATLTESVEATERIAVECDRLHEELSDVLAARIE